MTIDDKTIAIDYSGKPLTKDQYMNGNNQRIDIPATRKYQLNRVKYSDAIKSGSSLENNDIKVSIDNISNRRQVTLEKCWDKKTIPVFYLYNH